MADEQVQVGAAPAPPKAADKPDVKTDTVKGWFKAKEDCYLAQPYGYKSKDEVFYYEGPQHDSLVKAKAPRQDEE